MSLVRRALLVLPLAGLALLAGRPQISVADEFSRLDDVTLLSRAHYSQVERELRSADTSTLTPEQRERRKLVLTELNAYHRNGLAAFPRGDTGDSCRLPYFRDADGRHCGVANLMHRLGGAEFVDRIATTENHAYLSELADEPELIEWLDENGLSLWEAVRIHAPVVRQGRRKGGDNDDQRENPPTGEEDEGGGDSPPADDDEGGGDSPPTDDDNGGGDSPPTGDDDGGEMPPTDGDPPPTPPPGGDSPPSGDDVGGPEEDGGGGEDGEDGGNPNDTPSDDRGGDAADDRPSGETGDNSGPEISDDAPTGPVTPGRPDRPDGAGRGKRAGSGGRFGGTPSWVLWWEFNKADYLQPNGLTLEQPTTTAGAGDADSDEEDMAAARVQFQRERVMPSLVEALKSRDAHVRGASAVALARIAGKDATEHLLPLLADPQSTVREQVILALGVTGSQTATGVLRELARSGKYKKRQVSQSAQPLAITALGLGQHYGIADDARNDVAAVLAKTKRKDLDNVGTAALMHHLLAPGAALGQASRSIAADRNAPIAVRARAVEQLAELSDRKTLTKLQKLLASRQVELRRSAAIALGEIDDPLALPRIMTAFELESEPLTRGFLLVSIGRQGGKEAREFLVRTLLDGDQNQRPWAALALGVLARDGNDAFAREALRTAELPGESRGALWLALGISHDTQAVSRLSKAVANETSPWSRAYAALALGILGGEKARFALLDRHEAEKSDLVRTCIAQSLGSLGHEEDAALLVALLRGTSDPNMQSSISIAIGFHGSHGALDGLLAASRDDKLSDTAQAAAIDSIGLLLDRRPGFLLPTVYRRTNFDVMPRWMDVLFQTTL